jgi:hypothetical protein
MNMSTISESLLEKSKLVQHACEEGHRVGWEEAMILKLEVIATIGNTRKRPIWHA